MQRTMLCAHSFWSVVFVAFVAHSLSHITVSVQASVTSPVVYVVHGTVIKLTRLFYVLLQGIFYI